MSDDLVSLQTAQCTDASHHIRSQLGNLLGTATVRHAAFVATVDYLLGQRHCDAVADVVFRVTDNIDRDKIICVALALQRRDELLELLRVVLGELDQDLASSVIYGRCDFANVSGIGLRLLANLRGAGNSLDDESRYLDGGSALLVEDGTRYLDDSAAISRCSGGGSGDGGDGASAGSCSRKIRDGSAVLA